MINWASSKFKTFAMEKILLRGLKDKLQTGRKKELGSRIYKEHSKHNCKKKQSD